MERATGYGFSELNGREIFGLGQSKIWRCPVCAWWREWSQDRCCGCGTVRDKAADHAHGTATPNVSRAGSC